MFLVTVGKLARDFTFIAQHKVVISQRIVVFNSVSNDFFDP